MLLAVLSLRAYNAAHEAAVQVKPVLGLAPLHVDVLMPHTVCTFVVVGGIIEHRRCNVSRGFPVFVNLVCPALPSDLLPTISSACHAWR